MPSPPRLSVVIPSHNSRVLTLACLRSLPSGEVCPLDVCVVDDASEDGTCAEIAADFPEVRVLRSDRRRGFTVSANAGLKHVNGDLLLLLNSDTEVQPGSLTALVEAFDRNPALGIVGGRLRYPDGSPQWSGGREPSLLWLLVLATGLAGWLARLPGYRKVRPLDPGVGLSPVDWVTGAALAVRRDVWNRVGPLDERFRFYCQDLDFCRRAASEGWKVALLSDFQVLHHHGATIGRQAGAQRGRQHPELLWTDLVRWAQKHRGASWAARALAALRTGGRLRLLGRALAAPFIRSPHRSSFRRDTEAFRRALAALPRISSEGLP